MKVVKRVIVGVLVVALAAGGIYTGLEHVKKNKVTEVPVTSVSNLLTDWKQHWMEPSPQMFLRI